MVMFFSKIKFCVVEQIPGVGLLGTPDVDPKVPAKYGQAV